MTNRPDYRVLFFATVLLLLAPLAFVEYVPLVDLPGHLARIHILKNYDQVPQFHQTYQISGALIPYLTMDGILLALSYVMPLPQAARVFVALGIAVFALAIWTLSVAVHGRITPFAVLALFAQYNSMFFFGFVAFQLGVALALMAIGLWYRWRPAWTVGRIAVLLLLSVLIYFTHLGGYIYFGVGIGCLTIWTWLRDRRISPALLAGLLPLVPPILLYLSSRKSGGQMGQILYSSLPQKARHAMVLLIGYDVYVDMAVALLLIIAAVGAYRYGTFHFHREIGSVGVAFAIAFLVMPWWLLSGSDADTRMILGAGVLLPIALTCEISRTPGRFVYGLALFALTLRIVFCGWVWVQQSTFMAGHISLLDSLPEGTHLYPIARFSEDPKRNKFERVMAHVPDFAVIRRQAIVPTIFTVPGQHPVVERTHGWYQTDFEPSHPETFDWDRVRREYDTIWQYGEDAKLRALLDRQFRLTGQHGDARVYRTK